jgi:GTP-binding protein HflX
VAARVITDTAAQKRQVAVVVAVETPHGDWEESLQELRMLADTAGVEIASVVTQRREKPDAVSYVGKGKAREIEQEAAPSVTDADFLLVDAELTPTQQRNLELLADTPVIDRTALILDIFAQRARSNEGKLQVELAQLNYLLPRLTGRGGMLSRLGGGIGTRGPGETKLETDRRRIRRRISALRAAVEEVAKHRAVERSSREHAELPVASLVGYTNAGKSTLLNALADADALVEDKLFATLDPMVRRVDLPEGLKMLVSDTVGFIRDLPHELIASFRATLEEVLQADFLLHVMDAHHPQIRRHREAVEMVLAELGVVGKPILNVYNKIDLVPDPGAFRAWVADQMSAVVSARTGEGLDDLMAAMARLARERLQRVRVRLPLDRGDLVALAHEHGRVTEERYLDDGVEITAELPEEVAARLRENAQ